MSEHTQPNGARTRIRWNDIRIVGPLLVVALMMAALVSPQFAGVEQSVGTRGDDCFIDDSPSTDAELEVAATATFDAVGPLIGPCCPELAYDASVGGFVITPDECCIDTGSPAIVGAFIADCPVPVLEAEPGPIPAAIEGPIWLGATVASAEDRLIVLTPPVLLARFIDGNTIVVTNEAGDTVFEGTLGASGKIFLLVPAASGAGDYTMTTTLRTGAKYTEVISIGSDLG